MNREVKIGDEILTAHKEATEKFYSTQNNIIDDCSCNDCLFYSETVTNYPFEIFKILCDLGVDLKKNLTSEPTGVWCVRDDNGLLIHCDQAYTFAGQLNRNSDLEYSRTEGNFRVQATFQQTTVDCVYVSLEIGLKPTAPNIVNNQWRGSV